MYPDVSGKPLFIHKLIQAYPDIYMYILHKQTDVHTNIVAHPSMTEGKIEIICSALCHTSAVMNLPTADVSADLTVITTVLLQHALMFEHDCFLHTGLPQRDTVDAEIKIPCWESRADK